MASCRQPQRATSLLVATCFLLLICMSARPEPRSSTDHKKHLLQVSSDHGGGKAAAVFHKEKLQGEGMEQLKECREEECLMMRRRTLVAHTDYIYTQGNITRTS